MIVISALSLTGHMNAALLRNARSTLLRAIYLTLVHRLRSFTVLLHWALNHLSQRCEPSLRFVSIDSVHPVLVP